MQRNISPLVLMIRVDSLDINDVCSAVSTFKNVKTLKNARTPLYVQLRLEFRQVAIMMLGSKWRCFIVVLARGQNLKLAW